MRLYLLQLGLFPAWDDAVIPGYLIQTNDGKHILIDTGYPRTMLGAQDQAAARVLEDFPDISDLSAPAIRAIRDDPDDFIINRLAVLGLAPEDIDILVCTHFDWDHAGNHDLFPNADLVVQRRHYEAAPAYPRFRFFGMPWAAPGLKYRLVDGDTHLLPGITLLESSGHVPGHQSVLVRLPATGPVLLAADAIGWREHLDPETPELLQDMNHDEARASRRKLTTIAEREGVSLIVFGHDGEAWRTLRKSPEYYE